MEKDKLSEQEEDMELEDSEIDTSLAEDETASGKENVLRKRVTFDVNEESDSEARKQKSATAEDAADKGSSMGKVLVVLTLIFVVLSSFGFYFSNVPDDEQAAERVIEQLGKNMRIVRTKFASQAQHIWSDLYSGVEKVLLENPREPYVFLLVHRGPDATPSCLARNIAGIAHALINASEPKPLVMDGAALGKEKKFTDHKLLAQTYRPLVERHRVLTLSNVQLVPAKTAKGLHVFCNTAAPFVDQALYMVTLQVANGQGKENAKALAEKELYSIWSDVARDELKAAVSCLTSGAIMWIEPEKKMIDGC